MDISTRAKAAVDLATHPEDWLTAKEAAQLTGKSAEQIRALKGVRRLVLYDKTSRFNREDVLKALFGAKPEPAEAPARKVRRVKRPRKF